MNEPTAVGTQTQATPPAGGAAGTAGTTAADDDAALAEALVNAAIEGRGGLPQAQEGDDPRLTAVIEDNFRRDINDSIRDDIDALQEVEPLLSKSDAQRIVLADRKGDLVETVKAVQAAFRKIEEKESDSKEAENLRVEPANSGAEGEESTEVTGIGDSFRSLFSRARKSSTA